MRNLRPALASGSLLLVASKAFLYDTAYVRRYSLKPAPALASLASCLRCRCWRPANYREHPSLLAETGCCRL